MDENKRIAATLAAGLLAQRHLGPAYNPAPGDDAEFDKAAALAVGYYRACLRQLQSPQQG
ncbi:hypothetical protein ACW7BJ_27755 [Azospirillum argentinense]